MMHLNGQGVDQNYNEAAALLQQAAYQGLAQAQNNLGALYENGLGVTKSQKQAKEWFHKAAEQGHVSAQNNLDRLQ